MAESSEEPLLDLRTIDQLPVGDRATLLAAAILEATIDWRRRVVAAPNPWHEEVRALQAVLQQVIAGSITEVPKGEPST